MSDIHDIPVSVGIEMGNLPLIEEMATATGETVAEYMRGCIGLVAIWGAMIETTGHPTTLFQGIARDDTSIDLFEISDLLAEAQKAAILNEQFRDIARGITRKDEFIDVLESLRPILAIASEYYAADARRLITVAIDLRHVILEAQSEGYEYLFSGDGYEWYYALLAKNLGPGEEELGLFDDED